MHLLLNVFSRISICSFSCLHLLLRLCPFVFLQSDTGGNLRGRRATGNSFHDFMGVLIRVLKFCFRLHLQHVADISNEAWRKQEAAVLQELEAMVSDLLSLRVSACWGLLIAFIISFKFPA